MAQVKEKIKEKTKLFQVHKWRLSKEGKVMRKYKNEWWIDDIIQDVNSPLVHEIWELVVQGIIWIKEIWESVKIVIWKFLKPNEHYFEVCTKHDTFRTELKNRIDDLLKNEFNTINLLGMNEKVMRSKRLKKKHKRCLLMICEIY